MGRIEIGLKLVGDDISSALGIGTIHTIFQLSGQPAVMLRLKSFVKLGAILSAVCFNILADTSSITVELETSRFCSAEATYSSAIRIDSEQLVDAGG